MSGYRHRLHRDLNRVGDMFPPAVGTVMFCMLNPSTAVCGCPACRIVSGPGASKNDPSIRKCIGFGRRWEYGRLSVVNLFPFMATNPKEMLAVDEETAIGDGNDAAIMDEARGADRIVAAWGVNGRHLGRGAEVLRMLLGARRFCQGCGGQPLTGPPLSGACSFCGAPWIDREVWMLGPAAQGGQPRHPLYLPYETALVRLFSL